MTERARTVSKARAAKLLRRAGVTQARLDVILAQLPDPIDLDRAEAVFAAHGVTLWELMDRLGASP